jgi:uncharacterized membrane-anchored protein YjiN (DUF445 family)
MSRPRRPRRLALGVLIAAAAIVIVAFPFRGTWWGGWILAAAEAGVVGGLADWFAVTAIFRRPLGLPIPHTALVPANWEAMARRVGRMVGDRVVTKDYVVREVEGLDLADLLARGAERVSRQHLETVARAALAWVAEQMTPEATADLVGGGRRLLAERPLAPTVALAIEAAREQGWDRRALMAVARGLADALERPEVRAAVGEAIHDLLTRYQARLPLGRRMWLGLAELLGVIDRERILLAAGEGLRRIATEPEHPLTVRLLSELAEMPPRLREDAKVAVRIESAKLELLESPVVTRLLDEAAAALRRALAADLAASRSQVAAWLADQLERARRALVDDATLRRDFDRWAKARAAELIERHHGQLAAFVENGVRALGPEGAVRLIEEHAGEDLQYIRVNGTVVGAIAGAALYAVSQWVLARLF